MTSPCASNSQNTPSKTDESRDPPSSSYKIQIDKENRIGGGKGFYGPLYSSTYNAMEVAVRAFLESSSKYAKREIENLRNVGRH
ncbi:hypothetical protein B9Z55_027910 [Caenorhabditis nigoni]|uniref:Uncharacterized protein n=1 Tax=Caenorhabditis nigoni TaxID=1611254 RepID=A0A2G5SDW6_9PELO|nr:hypothetical protein B9Z55_027910 [Caenorhabditis nigoni]